MRACGGIKSGIIDIAFLGINGLRLTMSNDEAYEFIIAIASGQLDEVRGIAKALGRRMKPRRR